MKDIVIVILRKMNIYVIRNVQYHLRNAKEIAFCLLINQALVFAENVVVQKNVNYNKKCKYKAGHNETEHLCDATHYCKKECIYINDSINCIGVCNLKYGHNEKYPHICLLPKSSHKCNKKCFYKGKARECEENCVLEAFHTEEHNCSKIHLCNEKCYLKDISNNCKIQCNKLYGHKGKHKC